VNYWATLRGFKELFKHRLHFWFAGGLGLKSTLPEGHGEWGRRVLTAPGGGLGRGQGRDERAWPAKPRRAIRGVTSAFTCKGFVCRRPAGRSRSRYSGAGIRRWTQRFMDWKA
jgi:hypothetical protein